jgi:hypothetical protein
MSAANLMTSIKRTSVNVYEADIFKCSRQQTVRASVGRPCANRALWQHRPAPNDEVIRAPRLSHSEQVTVRERDKGRTVIKV